MSRTCQTCPDTDIDIEVDKDKDKEKDKDKDKEKDKEKRLKKTVDVFESFAKEDVELLNALQDYERLRKGIKNKALTPRAKELLCTQLRKLQGEGVRAQAHILALDDYKQVKVGLFSSGTASYRMALWRPGKTFPQGRRGPMKQESMKRYCLGFQNPATLVVERFNWPD
ncbi:MAG: hypothetical protein KMY50_04185 [Candidatus Desulforudis sp.]|nr:hypothetical protein [Desulforudis sp.]